MSLDNIITIVTVVISNLLTFILSRPKIKKMDRDNNGQVSISEIIEYYQHRDGK